MDSRVRGKRRREILTSLRGAAAPQNDKRGVLPLVRLRGRVVPSNDEDGGQRMIDITNLNTTVPNASNPVETPGLYAPVRIYRDGWGIPHAQAASAADAFFAQGFFTAQDRLWHMDYDRHRAYGRWAEMAGPIGLDNDRFMRRLRLEASARADYAFVNPEARAMLDAYAAGVNAFIQSADNFPVEHQLLQTAPEPWQPWDGLAIFKVRHVMMGTFEGKAWRHKLLGRLGPEATSRLHPGYQPGHLLILPPGAEFMGEATGALEELEQGAALADRLKELEKGSNNWTLSGQRTRSGKPLLAGDPHRGLDTPNVYYQNHIACPDFDVVGASFPGLPGFPHFGHNQWVSWGVTHTAADYQDLFVEKFDRDHPQYYEYKGQKRRAQVYRETIKVQGGTDEDIDITVTHHGSVISGGPKEGIGIAFRYTQTSEPNRTAEAVLRMLHARNAAELDASMEEWVDPVNNFLFADVEGNIGYLTRGRVPIRPRANGWLPVPGWTGEHEWRGYIPFDEMPRSHNPEANYIVTANQRVVGHDYPHYIALDHSPEFRARRIAIRLADMHAATVEDMGKVHAERTSIPAQHYVKRILGIETLRISSLRGALQLLEGWDCSMDADSMGATLFSAIRLHLDKRILRHVLGPLAEEALTETSRGGPAHAARLRAHFVHLMEQDDTSLLPPGATWDDLLAKAYIEAVNELVGSVGPEFTGRWEWGRHHHTAPTHPLSEAFPEAASLLDPPSVPAGGDGDTPQAASYSPAQPYAISSTSVLRYIYDLSDWGNCRWIAPLGSSGHPASPHYADQAQIWSQVEYIPMLYGWAQIAESAESCQLLQSPAEA